MNRGPIPIMTYQLCIFDVKMPNLSKLGLGVWQKRKREECPVYLSVLLVQRNPAM